MNNLKNIEILSENDMKLVTGGSVSIPVSARYLSKGVCLDKAQSLIDDGDVTGMTQQQIAEELYAHAVLDAGGITASALADNLDDYISKAAARKVADYLLSHCETIEIEDGGDTFVRRMAFKVIWQTM